MNRKALLSLGLAGVLALAAVPLALHTKNAAALEADAPDLSLRGLRGQSFAAADLLEEVYGSPVGEIEADWLAESKFFELQYSDAVPVSYVDVEEAGGAVKIRARPYRYLSASGKEVCFTPESVGDARFEKEGDLYSLTLDGATMSEDNLTVFYETEVTVPASAVNGMARAAYENGAVLAQKIALYGEEGEQYLEERARYEADLKAYGEYLAELAAYERAEEEYRAYTAALNDWKKRDEAYRAYCKEYEEYLAQKADFESYGDRLAAYNQALQTYRDYLAALEQYEKDYADYVEGLDSPQQRTALAQISYIDFIEEPALLDGAKRTLYSAITGNAVSTVLDNRDALIAYSRRFREPIELADKATRILREDVLPRYHALKSASMEEKYTFYIGYQAAARDAFCDLFRALDWLYRQKIVRAAIESKDRIPQYRILLAQLFYICNLLCDGPVANYDKTYMFGGTRYDFDDTYRIDGFVPRDLLQGSVIPEDGENAAPLEGGLPAMPDLPQEPAEVPSPGEMPKRPREPVEPEPVEPAGEAPAAVPEPVRPAEKTEPVEPLPFVPTPSERALADAFSAGEFVERAAWEEDFILTLRASCKKYLPSVEKSTLRYYFTEGEEGGFYEIECRAGERPDASKVEPYLDRTGYRCVFSEWLQESGGVRLPFDPEGLKAGDTVFLYPSFIEIPKEYPVVWEIEGELLKQSCPYGQAPAFEGTPEKRGEGVECFRFTGWSDGENFYPAGEDLPSMSENGAHYIACFEAVPLVFWSEGELPVSYQDGCYSADLGAAYLFADVSALFARASEEGAQVELVRSLSRFSFSKEAVRAVAESGAQTVLLTVSVSGEGAKSVYRYSVTFRGGEPDCEIYVRTPLFVDPACAYLLDGAGENVSFRTDGEEIVFRMRAGQTLLLQAMYAVFLNPSEFADFSTSAKEGLARPGETVTVEVGEFVPGRYLGSIYVTGADGTEIPVTENTFTMPESDVTVGITAAYHVYTVVFYSEGKAVRVSSYRYGEQIVPPADPSKPSDGEYSYRFTGWDHTPGICTGDEVFTARYASEKLPDPPKHGPSKFYILIMLLKIGGPILAAAVCAVATVLIVRKVRKKRRAKAKEEADAPEILQDGEGVSPEAGAAEGDPSAESAEKDDGSGNNFAEIEKK